MTDVSDPGARYQGEGTLSLVERLGGAPLVGVLLALPFLCVAVAVWRTGAVTPASVALPFAAGCGVLVFRAWRTGMFAVLASALRGTAPKHFRVEVDEIGVRQLDETGTALVDCDWFELESHVTSTVGLVVRLRRPKGAYQAVLVPRRFFTPHDWMGARALVLSRLPQYVPPRPTIWQVLLRIVLALVLWIVIVVGIVLWVFFVEPH